MYGRGSTHRPDSRKADVPSNGAGCPSARPRVRTSSLPPAPNTKTLPLIRRVAPGRRQHLQTPRRRSRSRQPPLCRLRGVYRFHLPRFLRATSICAAANPEIIAPPAGERRPPLRCLRCRGYCKRAIQGMNDSGWSRGVLTIIFVSVSFRSRAARRCTNSSASFKPPHVICRISSCTLHVVSFICVWIRC